MEVMMLWLTWWCNDWRINRSIKLEMRESWKERKETRGKWNSRRSRDQVSLSQPAVQVAVLWSLLDPYGLQCSSFPVMSFCLYYFCCIPVWSVVHVPSVQCHPVLSVILFTVYLCSVNLFSNVGYITVLTWDSVNHFFSLHCRSLALHLH